MKLEPIIYLRSDLLVGCACGKQQTEDNLGEFSSHFVVDHGYRITHSGQETSHAPEGGLWQSTVIVLTNQ